MTHTYTCNECNTYVVCHGENLIACSAKICIGCFMKDISSDLVKAFVWLKHSRHKFWEQTCQTTIEEFME